jgi:hypothetical protein
MTRLTTAREKFLEGVWLNLQNEFDIRTAKRQIGKELEKITPVTRRAAA